MNNENKNDEIKNNDFNEENTNVELKNNDLTEENTNDENNKIVNEPDNVTRQINLDELYDGAVNNTVVIDPVTNDEILLAEKKPNYTFIGILLAIIVLLVLYYVYNKTNIARPTKNVEPKTTVEKTTIKKTNSNNGTLTCTYNSKSDAETQRAVFVANYENNNLTDTNFNFVVISNLDTASAIIEDLKNQYENFYINNSAVIGNNITFEKNDKGFTFNIETNYDRSEFDKIIFEDGKTILYSKPSNTDTYQSIQDVYTKKGYTCVISQD